ncbi:MAG: hypothetical protein KC417_02065 [Myxococcales bacterium]|nr:hypothetical protein [Myxococcales bacterium]
MLTRSHALAALLITAFTVATFTAAMGPSLARAQDATATAGDADTTSAVEPAAPAEPAGPATTEEAKLTNAQIGLNDEQTLHEEREGVEATRDSSDPYEDPNESYYFLGLSGGMIVLPAFLINLFFDESPSLVQPAVGAEFTYRNDGFSIVANVFYAGYRGSGGFRLPGEPDTDTEFIQSSLSGLMASVTFLWSTEFSKFVALEYGVGIGLGYLFGDIRRTEAYPGSNGGWKKCNGPGDPGVAVTGDGGYCGTTVASADSRGEQYDVVAKKWGDGGDVPFLWPWLALPQIGVRIKPVKQMQLRANLSIGLGFYLGASASYGF